MNGLRLLVGIRFQVSFTPLVGVLFTFPSRYWCTIGRQGVLRLGGWSPRFQTGLHVSRLTRESCGRFRLRDCHPLWSSFPARSAVFRKTTGLVRVRSPLLTEFRLISFPPATEMFQFAGFASPTYGFGRGYRLRGGLPHSEIPGSKPARGSSGLFAACHVLHRLLAPRHPPDALHSLLPGRIASPSLQQDPPRTGENPARAACRFSLVKTLTLPNGFTRPATHSLFTMSKNKTALSRRRVCGPMPLFERRAWWR